LGGQDHDAAARRYFDADAPGLQPFPAVFLSFPSTKDGDWPKQHPGKSTAHIIAEVKAEWVRVLTL
jgi:all-trans-retinol 13,14-reductase